MMRLAARSILPLASWFSRYPQGPRGGTGGVAQQSVYGRLSLASRRFLCRRHCITRGCAGDAKALNGVSTSMGGDMRVVSSVGVGQRERAVLLQVGEQQVLLGVGPGNVRTLHVFDEPAVSATSSATPSFSDVGKSPQAKRGQSSESLDGV